MKEATSAVRAHGDLDVALPVYSGPFRLLADLVLSRKVDVCDVPVAEVTESFVRRGADALSGWTLEETTSFLATCAALLELKVGRLLPRLREPVVDEDLIGGPSPDLLFARALELRAFRDVLRVLADRMEEQALIHPRTAGPPTEYAHLYPDPLEKVSVGMIQAVAADLLASPPEVDLSHVAPIRASVGEAVRLVGSRIPTSGSARFAELVDDCRERIDVVVRFLALLELHREGKVELRQGGVFGEIEVLWQETAEGAASAFAEAGEGR